MSAPDSDPATRLKSLSDLELLSRLDLAAEVLEGMDELGVQTRVELEQLMRIIERRIADHE